MTDVYNRFTSLVPTGTSDVLFRELEGIVDRLVGVQLFTCSRFDLQAAKAERIFTNNAEAYPLTGLKDIVPNRWTRTVLDGRQPFLAEDIEGLRDVFPDHQKIEALGYGAAINLPVFVTGHFLGTVNLLHVNGHYSKKDLPALSPATLPASVAFLSTLLKNGTAGDNDSPAPGQ